MEILGITAVAAIAIICYLIGYSLNAWERFDSRKIPAIMGLCGAVLGIVSYYVAPQIMATDNVITAIAIGVVSGFAATGIDQIGKQMNKED